MIRRPPRSTLFPYTRSSDLPRGELHRAEAAPPQHLLHVMIHVAVRDVVELVAQPAPVRAGRSEEHTSELQSHVNLVCRLLLEKKKKKNTKRTLNEKTF